MKIKQLSISLENKPGMLSEVSDIIGKEGINIRAISVADTSDISTVRIVVDDPEKAINILKSHQFIIKETDVIAVETPDHPGGLNAVLKPLKQHNINVHYLYPFIAIVGKKAIIILGVDRIDEAEKILNEHWLKTYGKEIYNM